MKLAIQFSPDLRQPRQCRVVEPFFDAQQRVMFLGFLDGCARLGVGFADGVEEVVGLHYEGA